MALKVQVVEWMVKGECGKMVFKSYIAGFCCIDECLKKAFVVIGLKDV